MSDTSDVPIHLRALDGDTQLYRAPLQQGFAPRRQLREAGYKPLALRTATLCDDGVELTFDAVRMHAAHHRPGGTARANEPVDVVRQRLAAYAVVTSDAGVLLAQLSAQTGRPGLWILPGGGVDAGESPAAAVAREVWEEAGQEVTDVVLHDVSSSHRIGTGRGGLVEDFHAVRLVYAAHCAHPGEPTVHDVGGSTQHAAWFPVADVVDPTSPGYPSGGMAPWALEAVRAIVAADASNTAAPSVEPDGR